MPRKARSTGCRVCVRRRVRCDETRPFCNRCIKAGVNCSGFPPPIQWVDETRETQDRLQVASGDASSSMTRETWNGLVRWRQTPTMSPDDNFQYIATLTRELKDSPNSLYFTYLLSQFFATGRFHDFEGNQTWMTVCLTREEQHPTSVLATEALARAYFGRRQGYREAIEEGSRKYGQALVALCKDLKDPEKSLSYDTLAATVALTLYEHLIFTTRHGWVQHSQGVARLIEMRGPDGFVKYPERAILGMNRQILVLQAMTGRKRTFLEQERWIEIAWPELTERPPIVRMHDVFVKLPGITEDILRMENDPDIGASFVHLTRQKIDQMVDDLRVLQLDMLMDESRTAEEECMVLASPSKPFGNGVKYQSLLAANAWISFDAIFILALEWQYKSRHTEWQRGTNHEGMELIPETRYHAGHICRSVEYLLQPQWLASGSVYLLFPARVAFMALPVASHEALWIVGILERIAITSGFEMARNVLTNVQINEKHRNGSNSHDSMPKRALPAPSDVR